MCTEFLDRLWHTSFPKWVITSPTQVTTLQGQVEAHFGQHPAAEIIGSQPGLGPILGARVLAEFGDDPHRYISAKARKNCEDRVVSLRAVV